ncbi:cytochrome P450 [Flagelloscypha sp. PMI_526]|nr:cytochrome P450 [Flagelloscypha sp. PMI_526]
MSSLTDMHPIFTLCVACVVVVIIRRIKRNKEMLGSILSIRGPVSWNFLLGKFRIIRHTRTTLSMFSQYDDTFRLPTLFGGQLLVTRDLKAIQHIISNANPYERPSQNQTDLSHLLGKGLLRAEGDDHRRQRRILNPAFGPAEIKELIGLFNDEASKLCRQLQAKLKTSALDPVDMVPYLSRCTIQIIGLGGFGYDLRQSSLPKLFQNLVKSAGNPLLLIGGLLQNTFPFLGRIHTAQRRRINLAKAEMARVGEDLIRRAGDEVRMDPLRNTTVKESTAKRNILSLLVRANMSSDVPESQRLSDEEVISQIATFIVAGSATTSTALAWTIFVLCKYPECQLKLREEALGMTTNNPTMEELNSLAYLGNVVREVLRLYAPVTQTTRVAMRDDVIPLSNPIRTKQGISMHEIPVRKGQQIYLHILGVHRNPAIWEDDADEFKPERWDGQVPDGIPGIWGNLLTFLGGHRACIGYRFSIMELKAVLYALIRTFTFELGVPADLIAPSPTIISRPYVMGKNACGNNTLPVRLKMFASTK